MRQTSDNIDFDIIDPVEVVILDAGNSCPGMLLLHKFLFRCIMCKQCYGGSAS